MVLFGPAGNSDAFHLEGHTSSLESAKWVKDKGLDLFEYSFGRGYRMSSDMGQQIGQNFKKEGIELSLHAPYYINFANPDEEMFNKSLGYMKTGIKFMHNMGANRLVFHPGSCGKESRENAYTLMYNRFKMFMTELEKILDKNMFLCPETMGKTMQIGTYKEIVDLCTISPKLMPTFDFGHINSLTHGSLKCEDDYAKIFDYCAERLGEERTKNVHIHFSKIQYGEKGEIKHLTFADQIYGPNFDHLCNLLVKRNYNCHVICESQGTMAEDSLIMKKTYMNLFYN